MRYVSYVVSKGMLFETLILKSKCKPVLWNTPLQICSWDRLDDQHHDQVDVFLLILVQTKAKPR